ncbi:AMP-binding enzyme, partial [Variovorax sp. RHLX14]
EEWGEIVVAYIVAKPDVTPQVLDAHCVAHIARFKRPKHYVFVPELPKNSYGKVLKRELRQP